MDDSLVPAMPHSAKCLDSLCIRLIRTFQNLPQKVNSRSRKVVGLMLPPEGIETRTISVRQSGETTVLFLQIKHRVESPEQSSVAVLLAK